MHTQTHFETTIFKKIANKYTHFGSMSQYPKYSRPSGNSKFSKQRKKTMSVTLRKLWCLPSYPLEL